MSPVHAHSFAAGFAALPVLVLAYYAARQLTHRVVRRLEAPEPNNLPARVYLAARVFASRRVMIARLPHVTIAVTFGLAMSHQQRALMVLHDEFKPRAGTRW